MKILYPNARRLKKDKDTIEAWYLVLEEFSKIEVKKAIKKIYENSKYLPTLQDIIENTKKLFSVESMVRNDVIVIRVKYHDAIIPFLFNDKEKANEFIDILKMQPSREDIMLLHEKNVRENNPHTTSLRVDQSDRDEFEAKKRNEYYSRRLRQ